MNCQDITRILDDGNTDLLSEFEQSQAEAHRAACPHCALDWKIHQRLATSSAPALPVTLAARCRALVAARAGTQGRRTQSRVILFGAVLAVAAAAGMLGMQMMRPKVAPAQGVARNVTQALPGPAGVIVPAAIEGVEQVDPKPSADEPDVAVNGPRGPFASPWRLTVRIVPTTIVGTGVRAVAGVREFESALHDGLRRIPGMTLITDDASGFAPDARADFLILLTGNVNAGTEAWSIELRVEKLEEGGASRAAYTSLRAGVGPTGCVASANFMPQTDASVSAACPTIAQSAADEVERLRLAAFPPDPVFRQQLVDRMLDRRIDETLRINMLSRILSTTGFGDSRPTEAEVHAMLDIAATSLRPGSRKQVWRMLRNARHPGMLRPLIAAARGEPDDETRLEALTTLAAGFEQDVSARQAFQEIAARDARALHRGIAQRALSGEAGWAQFVKTTLNDSNLSGPQRLEPLIYMGLAGQWEQLVSHLDAEAVETIADFIPVLLRDRQTSGSIVPLYSIFGEVNHPSVVDIHVQTMRVLNTPSENGHIARRIAMHALTTKHGDDPRAHALLQELAANDVDPGVRRQAADALQENQLQPRR